jgi:glycerophosphoryl diester phosphodiesterase
MLEIVRGIGSPDTTLVTGCRFHVDGKTDLVSPLAGLVNIETAPPVDERDEILDRIVLQGWNGINVEHVELTSVLVEAAHRRGLLVGTWTVDTPAAIRRVMLLKCDYITSNYPDRVRHVYDLSQQDNCSREEL